MRLLLWIFFKTLLVLFTLSPMWNPANATHNMAGQVTYTKIAPNTYRILITTYTDPSNNVDDCSIDLEIWSVETQGPGLPENKSRIATLRNIPRSNGPRVPCNGRFGVHPSAGNGVTLRSPIKKNEYDTVYRFNGPGIFELRFGNYARIDGVKNMSNSVNTSFYVETRLNNLPRFFDNNSPILLNDPIDDACTGKIWTHNPGAFDPDGDSLVFSLVNSMQYDPSVMNRPISTDGFSNPGNVLGNGPFTINSQTGLITWNAAQADGWYNIAILIQEYRDGRLIGYVIRDMAINVKICRNDPPEIQAPDELCVRAGQRVTFPIKVTDSSTVVMYSMDSVYFYLNNNPDRRLGGPFAVRQNRARLYPKGNSSDTINLQNLPLRFRAPNALELEFEWNTICDHVRRTSYQVDYYAHDNRSYGTVVPRLATYDVTQIKVTAEPVRNVRATPASRKILVEWNRHSCESVAGYEVWRAINPLKEFGEDTVCCSYTAGIPARTGYRRIAYLVGADRLRFEDDNNGKGLEFKAQYCYRVMAVFRGNMRSCVSKDTCVRIEQDMPVITHNTVDLTEETSGQMTVRWVPPDTSKIKKEFFPPPYRYEVYRTSGLLGTDFALITPQPKEFKDTVLTDRNLNTADRPHRYRIRLLDNTGGEVAVSDPASSVFLTATASSNSVRLFWREAVPWVNKEYVIYKKLPDETEFRPVATLQGNENLIGNPDSIVSHTWSDRNLEKDKEYCYYIRAVGTYFSLTNDSLNNLINLSNRRCIITRDTVPPCFGGQDSLKAVSDCENFNLRFEWLTPDSLCADDLAFVTLYYSPTENGNFREIRRTSSPAELNLFIDNTLNESNIGCYRVTATDLSGNESPVRQTFCFDNCPDFLLPNVFTPNDDGINDVFRPISYRSIQNFSIQIFDRWGNAIHTSTDPTRLWDGKTGSGSNCAEGYYFYLLEYTANNLHQTKLRRSGGFTLLR